MPAKKYLVELTAEEREHLEHLRKKERVQLTAVPRKRISVDALSLL